MNQSYKAINSQYAVQPGLPIWGDLEGWVAYTYCANNPMKFADPTGEVLIFFSTSSYNAFLGLLKSFKGVNEDNVIKAFGIMKTDYVNQFHAPSFTRKKFGNNFKKQTGEKLRGKSLDKAYSIYKAMASEQTLEINSVSGSSGAFVSHQEKAGTELVDNIFKFAPTYNENSEWGKVKNSTGKGSNIVDEVFNNAFASKEGNNWKFFDFKNSNLGGNTNCIGTAAINGNHVNSNQHFGNVIFDIISSIPLKCTTCE